MNILWVLLLMIIFMYSIVFIYDESEILLYKKNLKQFYLYKNK